MRLTRRQQSEIAAKYRAGEPTAKIAMEYGVSLAYPTMLAARRGVPRRFPQKLYPKYASKRRSQE